MAVLDSNKTSQNLLKKGFLQAPGDHYYFEFWHNNLFITKTKISHGSKKDITGGLIKMMAEQCKLTKSEFLDLARCPMSQDKYIQLLVEKGLIKLQPKSLSDPNADKNHAHNK